MNRDDQLMSEPNKVIDDVIDFEAKILANAGTELAEALGNDYHEPKTIENFSIDNINEYGQVFSKSLPEASNENEGDYVVVKAELITDGKSVISDVKIISSGKNWYLVPPELDVDFVMKVAKDIESLQEQNTTFTA